MDSSELVSTKPGADFSRGCALLVIRLAFLLTHPTLPFVDRFMLVLSPSYQVSASHRSECLFTAPLSSYFSTVPAGLRCTHGSACTVRMPTEVNDQQVGKEE